MEPRHLQACSIPLPERSARCARGHAERSLSRRELDRLQSRRQSGFPRCPLRCPPCCGTGCPWVRRPPCSPGSCPPATRNRTRHCSGHRSELLCCTNRRCVCQRNPVEEREESYLQLVIQERLRSLRKDTVVLTNNMHEKNHKAALLFSRTTCSKNHKAALPFLRITCSKNNLRGVLPFSRTTRLKNCKEIPPFSQTTCSKNHKGIPAFLQITCSKN